MMAIDQGEFRRDSSENHSWIVVRTSGRKTLSLAASLSALGLNAWTPIEERSIRVPRMNVRRKAILPIMPSYVFVRSEALHDLLQMTDSVNPAFRPDLAFSVMRAPSGAALAIADRHLMGLRQLEVKRAPRKRARRLPPGLKVIVKQEGGSFAGMKGRVEKSDEGYTLVCFDNRLTVKISTSLLRDNEIESQATTAIQRAA